MKLLHGTGREISLSVYTVRLIRWQLSCNAHKIAKRQAFASAKGGSRERKNITTTKDKHQMDFMASSSSLGKRYDMVGEYKHKLKSAF